MLYFIILHIFGLRKDEEYQLTLTVKMRRIYSIVIAVLITKCLSAQQPQNFNNKTDSVIVSESTGHCTTTYGLGNSLDIYRPNSRLKGMITLNPDVQVYTNSNSYLSNQPKFFNGTLAIMNWKPATLTGYRNTDPLNGIWSNIYFKPSSATSSNYYDYTYRTPWLINTDRWAYDTFWTALFRDAFLNFKH